MTKKTKNDKRFYVYHLVDPRTSMPYYVGKGTRNRCNYHFTCPLEKSVNERLYYFIQKLKDLNVELKVIKIQENLTAEDAYEIEDQEIKKYGRKGFDEGGILLNIVYGGPKNFGLFGEANGFYGKKHSPESRKLMSQRQTGKKHSEETKQKMSRTRRGRKKTEEHKRRIGEKSRQRIHRPESKEKISKHFGKLWIITLPNGKEILVKSLNRFCKTFGLNYGNMSTVSTGKKKTCKGHKVRRYNPDTDAEKFPTINFQ